MKLSRQWISQYVDLSDQSDEDLERALTLIGFEVEGIDRFGLAPIEHLVVGEVASYEQHPNADRLRVCQVVTAEGGEARTIVCGAKNFSVGDRVAVALPGAVLPGGFKIGTSQLRGVESAGMLCSVKELGLGEDHDGILVLAEGPALGTPLNEVYGSEDTIFDIEVTPNRPDCLSHLGMARELAAYLRRELSYPEVKASPRDPFREPQRHLIRGVEVTSEACPHYQGWSIRGVKVAPSPRWLQQALSSIGLRPINNVVDVTNYVLHEIGQPLHAFDAGKIRGEMIAVRQAREGEKITTLDEKVRVLTARNLVIADAERALVVAGVMGSVDAEVDDATTEVVLEAAYFDPVSIRLTARRLGLSSDSSYRFERGIDPKGAEYAALRAIDLILETAGGELVGPPKVAGEPPLIEREIRITPHFVRERVGFEVSDGAVRAAFESLQLGVTEGEDEHGEIYFDVTIPSFRLDLERRVDLVEEFLRMHGTDKIPAAPVRAPALVAEDDPVAVYVREVAQRLAGKGLAECVHYSLRSESELRQWFTHAAAQTNALANPLASDQSHLRTSLLPGLLDAVRLNQNRGTQGSRLFEVGRVFREHGGSVWESVYAGFVLSLELPQSWQKREAPDFYTAQALVGEILQLAGVRLDTDALEAIEADDPWQEGHSARAGGFETGWEAKFGLLNLTLLRDWKIDGAVLAGGVSFLPEFLQKPRERAKYLAQSTQPAATRDLALVVDARTPAGTVRRDVEALAREVAGEAFAVEGVEAFDVYSGTGLPEGKKSLAFALRFRATDRTLKDGEVNRALEAIQKQLRERHGYELRG